MTDDSAARNGPGPTDPDVMGGPEPDEEGTDVLGGAEPSGDVMSSPARDRDRDDREDQA